MTARARGQREPRAMGSMGVQGRLHFGDDMLAAFG
jgi:hypothetical protein